jgi:hypothetical protein
LTGNVEAVVIELIVVETVVLDCCPVALSEVRLVDPIKTTAPKPTSAAMATITTTASFAIRTAMAR